MSDTTRVSYKRGKRTSGRRKPQGHRSSMWWRDPVSPGEAMLQVARNLESQQGARRRQWLTYGRLVHNQYLSSLYDVARSRESTEDSFLSWNGVLANVEAAEAQLYRARPQVAIETSGGDWSEQRQAAGLSKFVRGDQQRAGYQPECRKVWASGSTFGTGTLKIHEEDGKPACENVPVWELLIDDNEAQTGNPRSAIRGKPFHREVLADMLPEHRDRILDDLPGWSPDGRDDSSDWVLLYEGHHVGVKGDDGLRVLAVEGYEHALWQGAWKKDYLPYVSFRWAPRPGYWGRGIPEVLVGAQLDLNDINEAIAIAQHLVTGPKVFVPPNSGLNVDDLTNRYAQVCEMIGVPTFMITNGIPEQLLELRRETWKMMFQFIGTSEMDATGVKPAGLNSGEAQRVYADITSGRHVVVAQDWEDFHVAVADIWVDVAHDCYKNTDVSVAYKDSSQRVMRAVNWKKVNLKRDSLIFSRSPVSALPGLPSAKIDKLKEWFADGIIDKAAFLAEAGGGSIDLDAYAALANAGLDDIKDTIEDILDLGKYDPPTEYQNLKAGIPLVNSAYLRYKRLGLPESRQEMLRKWMDEASFITGAQNDGSMPTLAADPAMLAGGAPQVQATPGMTAPLLPPPMGAPPGLPPVAPPPPVDPAMAMAPPVM